MTAPAPENILQPPDSRMLRTIPAGKYGVQVNTGTADAPNWTWINGITNFEPKFDQKLEDDSDIYGDNWESQSVVGNAFTIDIEGSTKLDAEGVSLDPGLAVLLAKAEETGYDNYAHIRYWHRGVLLEGRESLFAVKVSSKGGKPNELQKWGGSLIGRGRPKNITKPTATP